MRGRPLSLEQTEAIAALCRTGVQLAAIAERQHVSWSAVQRVARSVDRPPCGCGRRAGHKGHCRHRNEAIVERMRQARLVWEGHPEADDVVLRRYAAGDAQKDIAVEVSVLLGKRVTATAVAVRAQRLMVFRPDDYMAFLRGARIIGRQKGSKNKRPYHNPHPQFRDPVTGCFIARKVVVDPAIQQKIVEVAVSPPAIVVQPRPPATRGFSMTVMEGHDPRRETWRQQARVANRGKV